MKPSYEFAAEVWRYNGKDPWIFITVPREYAQDIKLLTSGLTNKGFGTIKVDAMICETIWQTSIFPDKKSGSYMMPLKKEIRQKLDIQPGDNVQVQITLHGV